MERILEPEIMEDAEQALAYAKADFSTSNQWYVDHLVADFPKNLGNVLDIGCGPADVPVRLGRAHSTIRITAIDGSTAMLAHARKAVAGAGLQNRIATVQGYVPGLPFDEHSFDAVLSKDLLHHLPDPMVLWSEARRLGRRGAAVYVMDLFRPASSEAARSIVQTVAGNEHPILKEDFYNSLCAAFTVEEVRSQIRQSGLALDVIQTSDRHMLIRGLLP
ncbi:MAG TPA: class I SAM-dependent methyltransferase [Burkholderiales bacterium]|nr:class I SAM-dependent methyltransferase [Burkholderiales bacterium]